MKEVKAFAKKMMGTDDNRLDVKLNKELWSRGMTMCLTAFEFNCTENETRTRYVTEKLYTLITHVEVDSFSELGTVNVKAEEEK